VGLGPLHGFVTVNTSGMGSLAPRPTPNLVEQGLHYVCPYCFTYPAWVALLGAYSVAGKALRVTGARKPPLRDGPAVLEEA
jgi:hypothetical protein